jgi:rhodanese-related sulfurtransferase
MLMGNTNSVNKINFEDIQYILHNKDQYLLINTLEETSQDCLLPTTITPEKEIAIINNLLKTANKNIKIIIYGKNCNDDKIYKKYNQLQSLGFTNIYIYTGGLFEWLMLQDIYGDKEFPTSKKELDILKFKPQKKLNIPLLEY